MTYKIINKKYKNLMLSVKKHAVIANENKSKVVNKVLVQKRSHQSAPIVFNFFNIEYLRITNYFTLFSFIENGEDLGHFWAYLSMSFY